MFVINTVVLMADLYIIRFNSSKKKQKQKQKKTSKQTNKQTMKITSV